VVVLLASAAHREGDAEGSDLELMRLLDEEYTRHPFYGSRQLTRWLEERGTM
jgi:putative transposase